MQQNENKNTHHDILNLLEPVAIQNGFELVDVDITTEHGQRVLRAFIDKDGGVTVDDCARLSGFFEDVLDMSEVFTGRYVLEVSSPGLHRPLRTAGHFQKAVGQKIQLVTFEKINGRKNYKGILKSSDDKNVTLEIDDQDYVLPLEEIQKANVVYQFR